MSTALADQRVIPEVMNKHAHHFRYPTIDKALAHELGREKLWTAQQPEEIDEAGALRRRLTRFARFKASARGIGGFGRIKVKAAPLEIITFPSNAAFRVVSRLALSSAAFADTYRNTYWATVKPKLSRNLRSK